MISPTSEMLLLCAREVLEGEQEARVRDLAGQVGDWDALVRAAEFRLILPLVHRHLDALRPARMPSEALATLRAASLRIVTRNMTGIGVLRRIVREVLVPLDVPYVFTKGATLAYRCYREPALRMCRDLDLVVPAHALAVVGDALKASGFTAVVAGSETGLSDGAVRFRLRFAGQLSWLSPEGILVETDHGLGVGWGRLPTGDILSRAKAVPVAGTAVAVLDESDLLLHLCQHHMKHLWARLHWIADFAAASRHWHWSQSDATQLAHAHGLERTVAASFAINRAAAEPEPWRAQFDDPFARECFRRFLWNLEGDFTLEQRLRAEFRPREADLGPLQQLVDRIKDGAVHRLTPKLDDFFHLPLPPRLHAAYYLLRPALWVRRTFRSSR